MCAVEHPVWIQPHGTKRNRLDKEILTELEQQVVGGHLLAVRQSVRWIQNDLRKMHSITLNDIFSVVPPDFAVRNEIDDFVIEVRAYGKRLGVG